MNARQPEGAKPRQQRRRRIDRRLSGRQRVQLEVELGRAAQQPFQRAKHLDGPATKPRSSLDHTSVETSMAVFVIRMLFTEPGLPPRARLEMVPAVEMTVPFFEIGRAHV